jgi:hypothetical protein
MALPFRRRCKGIVLLTGEACKQAPLRDKDLCYWHDPENEKAAQEARRDGGLRRKRESTLAGAYEFEGILTDGGIARLLDIAAFDTLAQEAGHQKSRTLIAIVLAAEKVVHAAEVEERLIALESVMGDRLKNGGRR